MKNYLIRTIVSVILIAGLISCKKDAGTEPPVGPTNDFEIENIRVSSSQNDATVRFSTNLPSVSLIEYGENGDALSDVVYDTLVHIKFHESELLELNDNTEYFYRISAWTTDSLISQTVVKSFFTTDTSVVPEGPIISNILVSDTTMTSATITWDTKGVADSRVFWGLIDTSLIDSVSYPALLDHHVISLNDLEINTRYYFKVASEDEGGIKVTSETLSFITNDIPLDIKIESVDVLYVTGSSAAFYWATEFQSNSQIVYGTERDNLIQSGINDDVKHDHLVNIGEISPSQKYYYRVSSALNEFTVYSDTLIFETSQQFQIGLIDTTVQNNTTIRYPINVSNVTNLQGVEMKFLFDSGFLGFIPDSSMISQGDFVEETNANNFIVVSNERGEIELTVVWNTIVDGDKLLGTTANGSGELGYINFIARFPGEVIITAEEFYFGDVNANIISHEWTDGKIIITE